jgi:hypothetical protein
VTVRVPRIAPTQEELERLREYPLSNPYIEDYSLRSSDRPINLVNRVDRIIRIRTGHGLEPGENNRTILFLPHKHRFVFYYSKVLASLVRFLLTCFTNPTQSNQIPIFSSKKNQERTQRGRRGAEEGRDARDGWIRRKGSSVHIRVTRARCGGGRAGVCVVHPFSRWPCL